MICHPERIYSVAMQMPILQFLILIVSGWLARRQQDVVGYLLEENRVLREQLAGKRLRLTDGQCRRLAVKGHSGASDSECLPRSSRLTRSCGGTDNWWPPSMALAETVVPVALEPPETSVLILRTSGTFTSECSARLTMPGSNVSRLFTR